MFPIVASKCQLSSLHRALCRTRTILLSCPRTICATERWQNLLPGFDSGPEELGTKVCTGSKRFNSLPNQAIQPMLFKDLTNKL
jgi:hypothetical protein